MEEEAKECQTNLCPLDCRSVWRNDYYQQISEIIKIDSQCKFNADFPPGVPGLPAPAPVGREARAGGMSL